MLSEKSRPVIEATLPVIAERIGAITRKFYAGLFAAHPELLDGLFSRANQKNGTQQKALAGSIAAFATHLLQHPDTLPEAVLSRIAHKHASLGIVEEQYPIVYEHLFAAIADDLGDAVTSEVAEAWTEVYWLMADALIKLEKGLYARQANDKAWTPWRLVAREAAGGGSATFRFAPADDTPVTEALPGQYVSIRVALPDGVRQCRQYTLSGNVASRTERVVTAKLDEGGEVSPFLHRGLGIGDVVELSNPYGDLTIDAGGAPIVLATAGIGCTPSASALEALAAGASERRVLVLHAEQRADSWSLQAQMRSAVEALPNAELRLWLEDTTGAPGEWEAAEGLMDLSGLELPADATLYLCGPLPFMRAVRSQAIDAGIPATSIHYEVFGPDLWLAA
ncbi:globin domain-containing protein [Zafaria sp. Z1313]|uniref:globin domain-containing protein n=1 Tax=unclassified Zafaria TaxID=2828765 RepID=UPI002E761BFD|nr:globin domain-containing protein [Zafaria sp. J156]MEE1622057.1 globin domain-containing protein [Zafaria sp. J156]